MSQPIRVLRAAGMFLGATVLAVASGSAAAQSVASPMNLQRAPLFLNSSVDPNVALTMDDSGSMAWPYLPDTRSPGSGCQQRHPRHFWHGWNRIYFNPAVTYRPPLAADGTPFPNADFNAAWLDGYEAPGSPKTGKVGTPVRDLATAYFPKRTNQPANVNGGADFIGHDPRLRPSAPNLNLVPNLGTADPWFNNCTNPGAPVPTTPGISPANAWLPFTSANNQTTGTFFQGTTGGTSAAFYYNFTGDPAVAAQVADPRRYEAVNVATRTAAERQNFANWWSYYSNRYLLARTAMTRAFGVQDTNLRVAYQQIWSASPRFTPGTTTLNKFEGAARTAFFQSIYALPTPGGTPNKFGMDRAGRLFRHGSPTITNNTNPYWEASANRELSCRQNFHIQITDGYDNGGDPGAPTGGWIHLTNPQTLPDGRTYTPTSTQARVMGNIQTPHTAAGCVTPPPGGGACVSQGTIAFTYWARDLRPDLENNVPPFFSDTTTGVTGPLVTGPLGNPANNPEVYWNPENNPATWQHMVNFTVGLGVAGTRVWPNDYAAMRAGSLTWPAYNVNEVTVDDFWHAGVTSRGGFFSASNPEQLVDSLTAALASVVERRGTASAATVTSGIIQAGTLAFRTAFDSADWSGQVLAYRVGIDGRVIEPPVWEAGGLLTARSADSRVIITAAAADGGGVAFRWSELPDDYRAALNDNPVTSVIDDDSNGEQRLNYLRGDRSREVFNGGPFRSRSGLLGAVVNSGAVVVAGPSAAYSDIDFAGGPEAAASQTYPEFRDANRNRRRVIYVGANSGMMHAFDAGSGALGFDANGNPITDFGNGAELWAYVPREVAPYLSRLTNPTFEFTPYVDNTPVVRDVFINGRWRTLLVGALRRGGQGIFALDVTNPNVEEDDADDVVLWEFSDDIAGKERMGFTYGRPNIARLANGKWVVVVSGGYNSEQGGSAEPQSNPPDPADPAGGSTLFVLDAATGAEIRRFEFGPNTSRGLGTPTMGDYDADFIDELAVAGDLQGNLWRFDLSDPNPVNWSVVRMFQPATQFERPITSAPRLFPDPGSGGLIAVFSTGKYLEPGDRTTVGVPTQRLYGVRDYGAASPFYPVTDAALVAQTLTKVPAVPPAQATFTITNNALADSSRGWRVNLVDQGELGVTSAGALFSQGLAIFSTIIPAGDDPCRPGLSGNVYILNAATGGAPNIDRNGDGVVTAADLTAAVGQSVAQSVSEGSPALLVNMGGGIGTLVDFPDITVTTPVWRRRSWREFRPEE
ncbi:MAG: pilus assembly protein [Pseudomonadota bacterium]